jgi:transposase-like protein
MEKLVETLGITRLSKSQVSVMAKDLDEQVEAFRTRPLDPAPTRSSRPTRWCSKSATAGRTVNVHALLATAVNAARGLSGVALVTNDAHRGLVEAVGATLPTWLMIICDGTDSPAGTLWIGRHPDHDDCAYIIVQQELSAHMNRRTHGET